MDIKEIKTNKAKICNDILRDLPEWFGLEDPIRNYVKKVGKMPMFACIVQNQPVGFMSLKIHNPYTAEIFVMGIKKEYHRKGIGKKLVKKAEQYLKNKGFEFLTVKTLSASVRNKYYSRTRKFYTALGFKPIEEFKTLWDENNPCLFMLKSLVEKKSSTEKCIQRKMI